MNTDPIPEEVKELIARHIRSVAHMEMLLWLHGHRERDWTADELSLALRVSIEWADRELTELTQQGLIRSRESAPRRYYYTPPTPALDAAIGQLAGAYATRHVSVIQLIYAAPRKPIEHFADAFRIRKDVTDG